MHSAETQAGCFSNILNGRALWSKRSKSSGCSRCGPQQSQRNAQEKLQQVPVTKGQNPAIQCFSPSCDFACGSSDSWWNVDDDLPSYSPGPAPSTSQDVAASIDGMIDSLSASLRRLSMDIHGHPEIRFEERHAHDLLSDFMSSHGFTVTKHYLGLETAWKAEYSQGKGGRTIGINSEMDALPGIGHACGHNLIAVSGVGVALALKAALETHRYASGRIILLGTPAEESGGGKIILLERGGYDEMDACIMCHPGPGAPHSASTGATIAMQSITVEYYGHAAHAGAAPWEGTNALDAAFMAYSGVAVLRQQMRPDYRVHGTVEGRNWQPNVIPDYAKMCWLARAPTYTELSVFVTRVKNCLEAAALATGCRVELEMGQPYYDLQQNSVLAQHFTDVVGSRYGLVTSVTGSTASTDFGNISYALPALHPLYAIPTEPNGGNHTPAFCRAASTEAAHSATMVITKGLALTGYRFLTDSQFFEKVQASFLKRQAMRSG